MIIYLTINKINGKKYLGKDAKNDPNYLGSGLDLKSAIKKYGKENFKKEIIEYCSNKKELWEREEYWLEFYDVKNSKEFYNRTNKAFGAWEGRIYNKVTNKTKQKMSMAHQGIPLSKKHKQSISKAMKGHSKTEEWKKNLSEASSRSFGRPILQKDLKGNIIKEWETGKKAATELGLSYMAINACCVQNEKHLPRKRDKLKIGKYVSFNYIWEYKK
jgi:hypothetical protein